MDAKQLISHQSEIADLLAERPAANAAHRAAVHLLCHLILALFSYPQLPASVRVLDPEILGYTFHLQAAVPFLFSQVLAVVPSLLFLLLDDDGVLPRVCDDGDGGDARTHLLVQLHLFAVSRVSLYVHLTTPHGAWQRPHNREVRHRADSRV